MANRVLDYLQRARTSLGFGVHSPFAFKFICDVLCEKMHYYAYDDIQNLARKPECGLSESELRLLYRVAVRFAPFNLVIAGKCCPELFSLLLHANHAPDHGAECTTLLLLQSPAAGAECEVMELCATRLCVVFVANIGTDAVATKIYESLVADLDYGMMFAGHSCAVFVADSKLPHQLYKLNI